MVKAASGDSFRIGPLEIRFLTDGAETGGAVALFEFDVPPRAKVPVAHSHDAFEETVYGLRGVLHWTVDGAEYDLGPGEILTIRRGTVHRFENAGEADASALAIVTPAALPPAYFHDVETLFAAAADGPPDAAALADVMRTHGLTPHP